MVHKHCLVILPWGKERVGSGWICAVDQGQDLVRVLTWVVNKINCTGPACLGNSYVQQILPPANDFRVTEICYVLYTHITSPAYSHHCRTKGLARFPCSISWEDQVHSEQWQLMEGEPISQQFYWSSYFYSSLSFLTIYPHGSQDNLLKLQQNANILVCKYFNGFPSQWRIMMECYQAPRGSARDSCLIRTTPPTILFIFRPFEYATSSASNAFFLPLVFTSQLPILQESAYIVSL